MRICIDASSLLVRSAGVKNHIFHWIRSLRAHAPEHEIRAFPLLDNVGALDHERSTVGSWQTVSRMAMLQFGNKVSGRLIDAMVGDADVFHASLLVERVPRRPKLTATIFDMTAAILPDVHPDTFVRAESAHAERVLKRADALIANSESAKADAIRILGLDDRRIEVIPPGIDDRFFDAPPLRPGKPYVLFVGTIEPRKNIDALLDAWLELPLDLRREHDLVIAGPVGWKSHRTLERIRSGIVGVRYAGYIPESELPALTAGALVFVYPSLYEGFGLPPAQAMAAGVPVITSNVSSLPEVAGEAGVLVDPHDSFAIRDAIQSLLLSPSERDRLGRMAKERARRFTWQISARRSAAFFERIQ